jgi:DNA-binding CsgD family transcriptional regulator
MEIVTDSPTRTAHAVVPLVVLSVVIVMTVVGFSRGVWLPNLHNGLLAVAFAAVGAYILYQRPRHREGSLFLATAVVEGIMFLGRQIGHSPTDPLDGWWAWLGVWPLAAALALTTLSVIGFPDGRLPSPGWRPVVAIIVAVAAIFSVASALWPVEYSSAQITTVHPLNAAAPEVIATAWGAVAHPVYAGFQLLWIVAVAVRWRKANDSVRRQLAWLAVAATISVTALIVGLLAAGTPTPGLLSAALLPVAAGWAIVHGERTNEYVALSWLSREGLSDELPTGIARAAATALDAAGARLWMGSAVRLDAVGVWPPNGGFGASTTLAALEHDGHVRAVKRDDEVIGALSVDRPSGNALSASERRLFTDLASQAALVIAHVSLGALVARQRDSGQLPHLSRRERQVLNLMAMGLSNAAICAELHLSIKTVEPVVGTIFTKLGLVADAGSNRRVLAVLSYLQR